MTESSAARPAFAPALPHLNSRSYTPGPEFAPSYSRTRVFNYDLTTDQLKPLLEDCPTPGRTLRRIGGWSILGAYALLGIFFLFALVTVRVRMPGDFPTMQNLDVGTQVLSLVTTAAAAAWFAGALLDFVARKKWTAAVAEAWKRHAGHIVRVRDLPVERQQYVNSLGGRLDGALESLDANDPEAQALDLAARAAITWYFELPITSDDERRIAQSTVIDQSVQEIRAWYEATLTAEKAALQRAEDAVLAVVGYVESAKAAAADQEIITLARSIAGAAS